jgi:hypothetical protein
MLQINKRVNGTLICCRRVGPSLMNDLWGPSRSPGPAIRLRFSFLFHPLTSQAWARSAFKAEENIEPSRFVSTGLVVPNRVPCGSWWGRGCRPLVERLVGWDRARLRVARRLVLRNGYRNVSHGIRSGSILGPFSLHYLLSSFSTVYFILWWFLLVSC